MNFLTFQSMILPFGSTAIVKDAADAADKLSLAYHLANIGQTTTAFGAPMINANRDILKFFLELGMNINYYGSSTQSFVSSILAAVDGIIKLAQDGATKDVSSYKSIIDSKISSFTKSLPAPLAFIGPIISQTVNSIVNGILETGGRISFGVSSSISKLKGIIESIDVAGIAYTTMAIGFCLYWITAKFAPMPAMPPCVAPSPGVQVLFPGLPIPLNDLMKKAFQGAQTSEQATRNLFNCAIGHQFTVAGLYFGLVPTPLGPIGPVPIPWLGLINIPEPIKPKPTNISGTSNRGGSNVDGNTGESGNSGVSTNGTSGTSGTARTGTSGTSGTSRTGTSGASGGVRNGTSGTSGTARTGTAGTSGTARTGTSGTSGTARTGTAGTSGGTSTTPTTVATVKGNVVRISSSATYDGKLNIALQMFSSFGIGHSSIEPVLVNGKQDVGTTGGTANKYDFLTGTISRKDDFSYMNSKDPKYKLDYDGKYGIYPKINPESATAGRIKNTWIDRGYKNFINWSTFERRNTSWGSGQPYGTFIKDGKYYGAKPAGTGNIAAAIIGGKPDIIYGSQLFSKGTTPKPNVSIASGAISLCINNNKPSGLVNRDEWPFLGKIRTKDKKIMFFAGATMTPLPIITLGGILLEYFNSQGITVLSCAVGDGGGSTAFVVDGKPVLGGGRTVPIIIYW